jgi:GT2 family glycosyltransferase/glycosyltransferase involved in cell wall biosynthesis
LRTTLNIQDPLFITSPNGGGLLYAHRHLLIPLTDEDATGLASMADGLLWCVQTETEPLLREVRQGQFNAVEVGKTPLDLHDVLVDTTGTYVVFTETNQVARLDDAYKVQETWCFGNQPDSAHVNCIAIYNGRLVASMFGSFTSHRGYKGETRRAGKVVDVRTGETLVDGLSQPHSLVVVDEQLWLCSSEDRAVHVYNRDFQLERRVTLPGYTRGLAIGQDAVYVGISRSRNLVAGEVGQFASAVVAVLDRRSLEVFGYLPIPWNEIYDIRLAPTSEIVADIMASTWVHERQITQANRARDLELASQERLLLLQQTSDEKAALLQQAGDEIRRMQQEVASAHEATRAAAQRAETLQAELVESRGEVVKRDARIHLLERVRDELHLIKSSRSWRLTRPMRFVTRTIQRRGLTKDDRKKLPFFRHLNTSHERMAGQSAAPDLEGSPATAAGFISGRKLVQAKEMMLAPATENCRDFFVWAVIDWHFRIQRPQHLSRELALAGHRVFYISNHFNDHPQRGFTVEPLDTVGRLFQVHLNVQGSPAIYHASPGKAEQTQLQEGVAMLLEWTQSRACVSLIQHPYWLETAQILPNQRTVYDCMDHHGGFADNSEEVLAREHELMREADLLVVTSDWLDHEAGKYNSHRLMIRNACQYEHFSTRPASVFKDDRGRKVIGYYGAIAEWFDMELLEKVARRFSDCLVLLIGSDTCGARQSLSTLENVSFIGEVPYANLPYYLEGFDVCLLPFQIIPLTLATNPVKIYEYLSAGKEVVSIALPEIKQFGDLVRTGTDHATFLTALDEALHAPPDAQEIARRRQFANEQTWSHRVQDLVQGIENLSEPRVSVVVVTYNNLDLTQACLHSLEQYSEYANLEVIVVDNASADGTPNYLRTWAEQKRDRHILLNEENLGFAAANNQGLALASGDYLVMLNNDTYVTPGWISTLVRHLRCKEKLGMVGPVTNNIGNEARIDIRYDSMDEMLKVAGKYTRGHAGKLTALRTAAFFCVMMRREVYEKVGPLDEKFGIGFFEDDDYCRRVEEAGWSIACADDVFVHHNLSASFNKLKQETRQLLFERNKAIYEAKWGAWVPHKYRDS